MKQKHIFFWWILAIIPIQAQNLMVKVDIEAYKIPHSKDSVIKHITFEKFIRHQYKTYLSYTTTQCNNQFILPKDSGQFRMLVNSQNYNEDTLSFSVDVHTQIVNLGKIVLLQKLMLKELNEVTIVGDKKQFVKIDADKTTYLVKENPLLASGTMEEAIRKLPGVMLTPTGSINLHGKDAMIYIDEVPCTLSGQDLINYIQSLPATTIDKIELITNPGASFEANANGAVINIITRTTHFKHFSGTLDFTYGINQFHKSTYMPSLMLNGNNRNMNWQVQTGYDHLERNTSDFINRTFTSFTPEIYFFQHNQSDIPEHNFYFRPMLNFKINKTSHLILNYNLNRTNTTPSIFSNSYSRNVMPAIAYTNTYRNDTKNRNDEFVAKYKTLLDTSGKSLQITGYYLLFNKQAVGKSIQDQIDSTLYSINDIHLRIHNFYLKYDFELPFDRLKFQLNSGGKVSTFQANDLGQYNLGNHNVTVFNYPAYTSQLNFHYQETNLAFYAEGQKKWGNLQASAGLRMEEIHYTSSLPDDTILKNTTTKLFPSIHLLYKLSPAVNLVASYTRKIAMPFYAQLDPNNNSYFDSYNTASGNPFLQPTLYDNYACDLTAFDYFEIGAIYAHIHNVNILTYTTDPNSLVTRQTYLSYRHMQKFDIYTSFPVPFNILAQGMDIFTHPLNLDKMSYLFFDVEWHNQKIQDYPYIVNFKPYWIVDCSLQLLLPYKLKLFADYTYISTGISQIYQLEKPTQSFTIDLSRKFFKDNLGITLEATAPPVDHLLNPTANLNTKYTSSYDAKSLRIMLTYHFGSYRNKEEMEIKTEKKFIGNQIMPAI
ncbi:outer membrane beta-barrel family protein [Microbacter margulisiae]|uniref:Outer membrane protein beta-barrel domain-containing protein n=1 Tax=Microbacter margulisiae TaxID=1350067 RepID=A0A7W5H2G5_9PORP|nr:outer membrane beta-barrel family protein [Microbacter margulisiae]MBB3187401.1 hypothetical protein [Microbacter margulisiae]